MPDKKFQESSIAIFCEEWYNRREAAWFANVCKEVFVWTKK